MSHATFMVIKKCNSSIIYTLDFFMTLVMMAILVFTSSSAFLAMKDMTHSWDPNTLNALIIRHDQVRFVDSQLNVCWNER